MENNNPGCKLKRNVFLTGFTLIEVLTALIILLIAASGIFASFIAAKKYTARTGRRIMALNFTRQKLEQLRQYVRKDTWGASLNNLLWDPDETSASPRTLSGAFGSTWVGRRYYTTAAVSGQNYRDVTVTVSWSEPDD